MKFSEYIKTAFRWQKGRQNTGYDKLLILTGYLPLPFDIYLLRFPQGSEIPEHLDKVERGNHFRLNIIVKKAVEGGEFKCSECIWNTSRIKLFRPDKSIHSVSKIIKGTRYVLSIGWVK